MSKLTIKHFLNEKLKPIIIGDKKEYPVYVQITHKRHVQQIKSLLLGYMNEEKFDTDETLYIIRRETQIIESLYNYAESIITDYDIRKMSVTTRELLEWYTKPLNTILHEQTEYYKFECFIKQCKELINKTFNTNFEITMSSLGDWESVCYFLKNNKLEFEKIGINADIIINSNDIDNVDNLQNINIDYTDYKTIDNFTQYSRFRYGERNDKTDNDIIKRAIKYDTDLFEIKTAKTGSEEWKKAVLIFENERFELEEAYNLDKLLHYLNIYNFQTDSKVIEKCKDNKIDTDLIKEQIKQSFCKMIKK